MVAKFFRNGFLLCLPVLVLVGIYIWNDPFKIFWHYDSYYNNRQVNITNLNRNFTSTKTYLQNRESTPYNAFIFGNSRSCFYRKADWQAKIHTEGIYHFDGWQESLLNVAQKIRFLDKEKAKLDHALIVLDYSILTQTSEPKGHLFISYPNMSGVSWLQFHLEFFRTFALTEFREAYFDLLWSGEVKPYMLVKAIFNNNPVAYDCKSNEVQNFIADDLLARNPKEFYKGVRFPKRENSPMPYPATIGNNQLKLLHEISAIFKSHKTQYFIVINPLFDQRKLAATDLKKLKSIFGPDRVFDFSGKNRWTEPIQNYYEQSHYRPHVASAILDTIYGKGGQNAIPDSR